MVVTQYGRYSFWQTIGWSWSPGFGLRLSIGISFAMLIIGFMLAWLIGGGETQLDQLIASSMKARVATAVLATFTAPLVEEMVYRGVLFPAIQRATGAVWGVAAVSFLFALVHVVQYSNNLGVISVIVLLSIVLTSVRAFTGRLLPCFTIHLIFNAVQAALLLAEPFLRPLFEKAKAPAMILTYAFQCFS
ncbi:MAG: CPBP family intramembrane glutamic endopeptidase [Pyrinomonadaceae bacterium]